MELDGEAETAAGGEAEGDADELLIGTGDRVPPWEDAGTSEGSSLPSTTPSIATAPTSAFSFAPISHNTTQSSVQMRKLSIPPHRMTPLKKEWEKLYTPLVKECGLKVRVNPSKRTVEIKTSKHTPASSTLQKAIDFLTAFMLGFTPEDSLALLRMDDLYIESFEVKDVKQILSGDHLSRAIGRIAGKDGKTKFAIENASRTRVVLADQKIHILGTFQSIKIARDAICQLILGSPPGKVYAGLRNVAAKQKMRG
ncbi:hypothetical protein BT69DRAFT_1211565 [Atractiella rhizophila]|nr:hypothetical protein BT69DRAFT_1211565 [Atractiella rhizophila]